MIYVDPVWTPIGTATGLVMIISGAYVGIRREGLASLVLCYAAGGYLTILGAWVDPTHLKLPGVALILIYLWSGWRLISYHREIRAMRRAYERQVTLLGRQYRRW